MFSRSIQTINELMSLLKKIQDGDNYSKPVISLGGATDRPNTPRHIIELYQCLLEGYDCGVVNYDKRKRDPVAGDGLSQSMYRITSHQRKAEAG